MNMECAVGPLHILVHYANIVTNRFPLIQSSEAKKVQMNGEWINMPFHALLSAWMKGHFH